MKQSEFVAINANLLKAREKFRAQVAIGFCFASRRLKNWREILSNGDYFPQSFENCPNFIWSHCFLGPISPSFYSRTSLPIPQTEMKDH